MAAQREERAGAAELFERSRFSESLAAYSTTEDGGHDAPSKAVYTACNRAAAKLGLEMFRACIRDVDDAIKIDPFCLRAYILKGKRGLNNVEVYGVVKIQEGCIVHTLRCRGMYWQMLCVRLDYGPCAIVGIYVGEHMHVATQFWMSTE